MNIPLEQIGISGATLITAFVSGIMAWQKMNDRIERYGEKITETTRQIEAHWKWKDEHEKFLIEYHEKINAEIASLKAANLVVNEQYRHIVTILQEIKNELNDLKDRK